MSTTFSVYPQRVGIPTFRQVLELATTRTEGFLRRHHITQPFSLELQLLTKKGDEPQPLDLDAPAMWPDEWYAWFSVPPVPGGTDGYFWPSDEDYREELREVVQGADQARKMWVEACI